MGQWDDDTSYLEMIRMISTSEEATPAATWDEIVLDQSSEDRIKEVMIILNGPIRFSYPSAWKMDQWKGAIQAEWIMMDEAAVGVPQHHWSTQGKRWRHSGGGDHSPASLPSL
ncbi:unnamed protein product [Microthlaspi erraticum]|uniref:Uncharacterized protein n=1 Tax=Microthlaspi erraticum TaxID=1685480 RepID=A0A6D2JY96_9BRAS|nr:unnamed protein product [Microthlaspi erraticum]